MVLCTSAQVPVFTIRTPLSTIILSYLPIRLIDIHPQLGPDRPPRTFPFTRILDLKLDRHIRICRVRLDVCPVQEHAQLGPVHKGGISASSSSGSSMLLRYLPRQPYMLTLDRLPSRLRGTRLSSSALASPLHEARALKRRLLTMRDKRRPT